MPSSSSAKIEKSVLKKISPLQPEVDDIHKFLGRLHDETRKLGCEGIAAGSSGKHTWLSGDHDIDWFVLFPKNMSRDELEKKGLVLGKKLAKILHGKPQIKYAEHPYTRIILGRFSAKQTPPSAEGACNRKSRATARYHIDVVPCYRIEPGEKIISAVDRSPLHLHFVREKLPASCQDDVRLLKQFLKGIHVYGSDARHAGFSGYIAELLVIKYGNFASVIKEASQWKPGIFISFEKSAMKSAKAPLVLIDPVDSGRNVAAALSAEKFLSFVAACKSYLKKPSEEFFFPKERRLSSSEIKKLQSRGTYWFAFVMKKPDIIDDILWPQMRRASARITGLLKKNDYEVYTSDVFATEKNIILFFELEEGQKPPAEKMAGPSIYAGQHLDQFLAKYAQAEFGTYIEGDIIVAYRRRSMLRASQIADIKKWSVQKLGESGIPDNIAKPLKKSRFIGQKKFWKFGRKNREFSKFLWMKYFERF